MNSSHTYERPEKSGFTSVKESSISSIERSVTHLLVATKQLLETLTSWSRGLANENEVSDVYVRLGSEFNNACRSFMAIGIETSDLGNVPDELRSILESTLSQQANPSSLEIYLPKIREIIINLLHGLKRKQSKLRVKREPQEQELNPRLQRPGTQKDRGVSVRSNNSDAQLSNPSIEEKYEIQKEEDGEYAIPRADVLVALKADHTLERRASRRYSAFYGKDIGKRQETSMSGTEIPSGSANLRTHADPKVPILQPIKSPQETLLVKELNNLSADGTITLFLHWEGIVKKASLPSSHPPTYKSLISAFSIAFGMNSDWGSARIWILDKKWGERYLLEEFSEVTDGSVLFMAKAEAPLDSTLSRLETIEKAINKMASELNRERETLVGLNDNCLSFMKFSKPTQYQTVGCENALLDRYRQDIHELVDDLQNLKASYSKPITLVSKALPELRKMLAILQRSQKERSVGSVGRAYVNSKKEILLVESDRLVYQVDSIQDSIEDLRKSILDRGRLPPSNAFSLIFSELKASQEDIDRMARFISIEKPKWKEVWEFELERVCEDQQFCDMQEELAADLKDDLVKALRTFELIKQCGLNPLKQSASSASLALKPTKEEKGNILQEIKAVAPNHGNRIAAIEKLETTRDLKVKALSTGICMTTILP